MAGNCNTRIVGGILRGVAAMDISVESLTIELTVANMVIPSMPIHLDDVLAAAAVKTAIDERREGIDSFDEIINNLPLEKYSVEDDWVYKASAFTFTAMRGKYMRPFLQKIDKDRFAAMRNEGTILMRSNNIALNKGPFKTSLDIKPTAAYTQCYAHCIGNQEQVTNLLKSLTHFGKKHQRGQGIIVEARVTPTDEVDGWQYRFLPLSMAKIVLEEHVKSADIGTRPPYWKAQHSFAYGIANYYLN